MCRVGTGFARRIEACMGEEREFGDDMKSSIIIFNNGI
jgi:hypothetical protein